MNAVMPWHLRAAVQALRMGGVIAYPTEAVWGLGCEPMNERAVERILALKRRDWRKGLILIAGDFAQLEPYVRLPSRNAMKRAQATWPGPATWVFPAAPEAPLWVTGDHDSIAVRVTAHPVAVALCAAYGGAIISTSANRSGQEPARSASELRRQFPTGIDYLVPGALFDSSRAAMSCGPSRRSAAGDDWSPRAMGYRGADAFSRIRLELDPKP
jgi:L-threonylcarbamoyladenylate synthase